MKHHLYFSKWIYVLSPWFLECPFIYFYTFFYIYFYILTRILAIEKLLVVISLCIYSISNSDYIQNIKFYENVSVLNWSKNSHTDWDFSLLGIAAPTCSNASEFINAWADTFLFFCSKWPLLWHNHAPNMPLMVHVSHHILFFIFFT